MDFVIHWCHTHMLNNSMSSAVQPVRRKEEELERNAASFFQRV